MPASEVEICNLALLRVGVTTPLNALTDGTKEANTCNTLYAQSRDLLLSMYPWSFATRREVLTEITDTNDADYEAPRTGWQHIYNLPEEVLGVQRIWPGHRRVRAENEIPFKVEAATDGEGRVLLTDAVDPEVFVTIRVSRVSNFSPWFADALSSYLASELVVPLALAVALMDGALKRFQISFANGVAADANQHREDPPPRDSFTAARFGAHGSAPYDVPVISTEAP